MSEEVEIAMLVCGDAEDLEEIPGSIIVQCNSCNKDLMASPSGQRAMKEKNAKPICGRCAHLSILTYKNQTGKTPKSEMAAGAASELTEWMRKNREEWL